MVFSSSVFLLYFLPLFLLVYYLVNKKLKNYVILAASIVFYSWGAPKFVFVIIASTLLDFNIVKWLHHSKEKRKRQLFLFLSIFMNVGLLMFFKYSNFFIENVNSFLELLGFQNVKWTNVALPIGISFYTFQTLTYSIDVYRKAHTPLNKITDYLLYIMSFPQMIAGPIVRFNTIADQITSRTETIDKKLIGFYRFTIGLAKKVLIANVMGEQTDIIMNGNIAGLDAGAAWLGLFAYTFQIYFDFSGYSDMAIGLGKMMGFSFPENFNSPYTSTSISEFWRRWHMTLGGFMRDYLYIPLGGSKVSTKSRLFFNLWIVFLLSGLWHGASWNFIVWGAYHGLFLILDRIFLIKFLNKIGRIPGTLITFFVVIMGWVVFRLENSQ
ncbi:MBOAT family O-acyltransferase, partial [Bacteroidota bacterium]